MRVIRVATAARANTGDTSSGESHTRTHTHARTHTHTHTHAQTRAHRDTCTQARTHTYTRARTRTHTFLSACCPCCCFLMCEPTVALVARPCCFSRCFLTLNFAQLWLCSFPPKLRPPSKNLNWLEGPGRTIEIPMHCRVFFCFCRCVCPPNTKGFLCEFKTNPCDKKPCKNDGKCIGMASGDHK